MADLPCKTKRANICFLAFCHAGCKLHIQLSQLLGEAGLVLVRQTSALVLASSSYAVPAALGECPCG